MDTKADKKPTNNRKPPAPEAVPTDKEPDKQPVMVITVDAENNIGYQTTLAAGRALQVALGVATDLARKTFG